MNHVPTGIRIFLEIKRFFKVYEPSQCLGVDVATLVTSDVRETKCTPFVYISTRYTLTGYFPFPGIARMKVPQLTVLRYSSCSRKLIPIKGWRLKNRLVRRGKRVKMLVSRIVKCRIISCYSVRELGMRHQKFWITVSTYISCDRYANDDRYSSLQKNQVTQFR